jgi:hypothetical protein
LVARSSAARESSVIGAAVCPHNIMTMIKMHTMYGESPQRTSPPPGATFAPRRSGVRVPLAPQSLYGFDQVIVLIAAQLNSPRTSRMWPRSCRRYGSRPKPAASENLRVAPPSVRPGLGAQDRCLQVLRASTARSRSSVTSAKAKTRRPWSSPRRARISCRCMCLEPRARSHFLQRALVRRGFANGN